MLIKAFNMPIARMPNKLKNPAIPVSSRMPKANTLFHSLRKNMKTIRIRGKANLFSEYDNIKSFALALTMIIKAE